MNNELRELLSKEKDFALRSKQERSLSKEKQRKLTEDRYIEKRLKDAKENELELSNRIAKELIDTYIKLLQKPLYIEKPKIDYSFALKNMYRFCDNHGINETIWFDNDTIIFKLKTDDKLAFIHGKIVANANEPLSVWQSTIGNSDKYDLVYINKKFFAKQNIKIKNDHSIPCVSFNDEALNNFVKNVLAKNFSELSLDDNYINDIKKRLKEIDRDRAIIKEFREMSIRNAEILTLDICKIAIQNYADTQNYQLHTDKKTCEFRLDGILERDALDLCSTDEEERNVLYKYDYSGWVVGFQHDKNGKKVNLPVIIKDLYKLLKEIGITCQYRPDTIDFRFIVNVSKFEEAIFAASKEEEDLVKKV